MLFLRLLFYYLIWQENTSLRTGFTSSVIYHNRIISDGKEVIKLQYPYTGTVKFIPTFTLLL